MPHMYTSMTGDDSEMDQMTRCLATLLKIKSKLILKGSDWEWYIIGIHRLMVQFRSTSKQYNVLLNYEDCRPHLLHLVRLSLARPWFSCFVQKNKRAWYQKLHDVLCVSRVMVLSLGGQLLSECYCPQLVKGKALRLTNWSTIIIQRQIS